MTTLGYLVLRNGIPQQEAHTEAIVGLLFPASNRRAATVFLTRPAATRVIRQSQRYYARQGFAVGPYMIQRLQAARTP
jgi:hypothetical protein